MKKSIFISALAMVVSVAAFAQSPAEKQAKDILTGVSAKYRSFDAIKTDFSYTLENPSEKINETQNGTLYIKQKSNKYKVILGGTELFSDGKLSYTYLKDSKEIQINNLEKNGEGLNPAQIFTIYEKGFKYLLKGEKKEGATTVQLIDLVPVVTKQFSKIELSVDKKQKQLKQIKIFDKNGNRYTYKVKTFVLNPKVDDAFFAFDKKKYPGVEVVDLR
ncbi:LolA family protein [Solitalea canadensis]|uniref:Outer membrane lipoprotein-sorting protein n=1 Tax=Solitalea canadensis (strain ATCC 29591 / DSM 3403 / JCM 21819 / LMG 8368 / NBRC 15130 / NCIMB 12057 / USAM 9D) TaxID=929556 RepID=H8KPM1_SOLCM|nr:outer membrane lipoprotein carrier protein LolA [Solitalea canadensis]AFD05919.1 outer membrane lipoprotein-sorting protein [Solitalea canadensis DSM 3403]